MVNQVIVTFTVIKSSSGYFIKCISEVFTSQKSSLIQFRAVLFTQF